MRPAILMSAVILIIMLLLAGVSIGCASTPEPKSVQPKPAETPAAPAQPAPAPAPAPTPAPAPAPTQKQPSPIDDKAISLREIRGNPKLYSGKDVVISGVLFNICCGTDFVFKDGLDTIQVVVTEQAPMPPTSKIGAKIRVLGTVKVSYDNVVVVGKEIKFQ